MADKLTPKQEQFARKFVECGIAAEAYRYAYNVGENTTPESVWVNACKTLGNDKVAQRVAELQEAAQKRTLVTVESITAELNESRSLAIEQDNPAEMTKATMAKAKIHGLDVHKIDASVGFKVTIKDDDAEL
jgi:hypothetical protein